MSGASTWLIVGLGNPGRKYERTRHNVGFMVADEIAKRLPGDGKLRRFDADILERRTNLGRVVIVKPQTFMNVSGNAVGPAVRWYHVPLDQLLVIYDDLDLPFGRMRIRPSGSSGGHNGVTSIIQRLGTDQFPRLRLGIGRAANSGAISHVLSRFDRSEEKALKDYVGRAASAAIRWHFEGIDVAMNEFNRAVELDEATSE
ncbi:MAG: aminoacyl-tRNA hydrolase [Nitrolancea sp.]